VCLCGGGGHIRHVLRYVCIASIACVYVSVCVGRVCMSSVCVCVGVRWAGRFLVRHVCSMRAVVGKR